MIYMVENNFADPGREARWNAWYSEHVNHAFRTIPGWRTGQRFAGLPRTQPKYRAMYTLDTADVLTSAAYRATTGGRFPEEWRPFITHIQRNLADGDWMPAVESDQRLVVVDEPGHGDTLPDVDLTWWNVVGLDRSIERRAIAVVTKPEGEALDERGLAGVGVYAPLFDRFLV